MIEPISEWVPLRDDAPGLFEAGEGEEEIPL